MNWQEWMVLAIVLVAVVYAGRVFVRQFTFGKNTEQDGCANCGPGGKSDHKPKQDFARKPS